MFLLVPARPGSPGRRTVKQVCVCVCLAAKTSVKLCRVLVWTLVVAVLLL